MILQSFDNTTDANIITFHDYLEQGKNVPNARVQTAIETVKVDDLATIMYTSGTIEAPKGIMFSQLNIVSKRFARAIALPEIGDQDRFLCYLPFFHTFGRFFEMMGCIFWGSVYVFMESPNFETMIENFQLAKPTVFISIPKKWMQLFEKIQEKVDIDVASPSTIQAEISNITGGHLKWGLSAAGYLDPDIFQFFQNYGVELMSGFGMTEATGGITMTPPYQYRHNSVGKALPGIEINLAEDGEMRIRGPYVMMGYFQSESVSFRDGWFDTGDIFSKDAEEFYQILDRKKEIYKNIRGETIAPQKIENLFLDFDSIKHVFLVGDHRAYNSLLLYPNYDYDQLDFSKMNHEELREFFSSLIVSVNRFLAPYERIVDFTIIERDFEADKGELTPKGTFKRKVVEKNFEEIIRNLYQKDYATLSVGAFEIRIPNWFLREKALTSDDLKLEDNIIVLNPPKSKLQVHFSADLPGVVRIGTFTYSTQYDYFDIGQLIHYPSLWLGNIEFENFVGEEIFRWSRLNDENDSELKIVNIHAAPKYEQSINVKLNKIIEQNHKNLPGIHYSAYLISTCNETAALQAFDYIESIIQDKNEKLAMLAKAVLMRTSHLENKAIKKQAFRILITNEKRDLFKNILRIFLQTNGNILDKEIITKISERDLAQNQIKDIFSLLKDCADQEREHGVESPQNTILSLLNLITCYGVMHPVWYKSIRSELVKWTLYETDKEVAQFAEMCVANLVSNFRDWLGTNVRIAVDPETTQEY
ncbi:MAG: AMP-binding protein, partial [bacterium]